MSEDDRAAKAARAKALLKKRQQKKAVDSAAASSGVASNGSPSRTSTPAPSEPAAVDEDGRDLGDVFSKDTSDTSWLTSLPRVASPPLPPTVSVPNVTTPLHGGIPTSPPHAVASNNTPPLKASSPSSSNVALQQTLDSLSKENESLKASVSRLQSFEAAAQQAEASLLTERKHVEDLQHNYNKLQADSELSLQNERRTVSLLVSEKAHLISELEKRDNFESKAQELEDLLGAEQTKSSSLNEQVVQLRTEIRSLSNRVERSEAKEKDLAERYKEQERQLQITTASASELRKEAEESKRKLRELEEQVQNDDRVERLETSLKNTQDRADELEFQLTKLKQAHISLKSEKDGIEKQLSASSASEAGRSAKIAELTAQFSEAREKLSVIEQERDGIAEEQSKLRNLSASQEISIKEHQERLTQAAAALATSARQLQNTQHELKNAIKRADDSERAQQSLQAEGTNLMRSLDEMRPKIVELTGAKLDLAEKVESLEHTLRNRDSVIAQLENDLGEAQNQVEEVEAVWKEKLTEQEKRHREIQSGNSDIQKAYAELQEELDTALASLRNLETQRTNAHQEAVRRMEEIENLKNQAQAQGEELDALRQELEARRKAHDEEQDFLERAQNEIEALRTELSARESEIEELQDVVNSPTEASRSLDDEMLGSIRQQHAMEISAATSQIRAFENTIFDKDSTNHKLQKQISALEEQLVKLRPGSQLARRASPSANADRRTSLGSHRPSQPPPPLSRTIFDHVMTPETMHKRKVSLSMLKARIDSEVKATSQPSSRALSPVHSDGHSHKHSRPSSVAGAGHHVHRPQFLDESHVFWCASCQGDLVIL